MTGRERVVALVEAVMGDLGHGESFVAAIAADLRLDLDIALEMLLTVQTAMEQLDWEERAIAFTEQFTELSWGDLDEEARGQLLRGIRAAFALSLGSRLCREATLLDEADPFDPRTG